MKTKPKSKSIVIKDAQVSADGFMCGRTELPIGQRVQITARVLPPTDCISRPSQKKHTLTLTDDQVYALREALGMSGSLVARDLALRLVSLQLQSAG